MQLLKRSHLYFPTRQVAWPIRSLLGGAGIRQFRNLWISEATSANVKSRRSTNSNDLCGMHRQRKSKRRFIPPFRGLFHSAFCVKAECLILLFVWGCGFQLSFLQLGTIIRNNCIEAAVPYCRNYFRFEVATYSDNSRSSTAEQQQQQQQQEA